MVHVIAYANCKRVLLLCIKLLKVWIKWLCSADTVRMHLILQHVHLTNRHTDRQTCSDYIVEYTMMRLHLVQFSPSKPPKQQVSFKYAIFTFENFFHIQGAYIPILL